MLWPKLECGTRYADQQAQIGQKVRASRLGGQNYQFVPDFALQKHTFAGVVTGTPQTGADEGSRT